MSSLKDIENEISKSNNKNFFKDNDTATFLLKKADEINIIQTPNIWGVKFNDQNTIKNSAKQSVNNMADILTGMIESAKNNVDIVSLAPPDGIFYDAIVNALVKNVLNNENRLLVRFLFGYLPGGEDTVQTFRTTLTTSIKTKLLKKNKDFELLVGRVHGDQSGGGWGPLSYWNHAKIVAVDGIQAFVGGHNLWPIGYGEYPPVHDISLHIKGEAASAAQAFANFMWTISGTNISGRAVFIRYYKFDWKKFEFPNSKTISLNRWEKSPPQLATFDNNDSGSIDMLGVGRFPPMQNAGLIANNSQSPSEVAKEYIITNATKNLYISQQDLVFASAAKDNDHKVIIWIIDALKSNKNLNIYIVVSPINAKSKDGAQYSWGSGANGTYVKLFARVNGLFCNEKEKIDILKRLHIAPFCFNKVMLSSLGEGHSWPNTEKYKFKNAQFSTKVPMPKLYHSAYPEPANHAKFYMAEDNNGDRVYYVGSDNLYPHNLFEFGFLVDNKQETKKMFDDYWSKVWQYSGKNCVCYFCGGSNYGALKDILHEYYSTLGGFFRNTSQSSLNATRYIEAYLTQKNLDPTDKEISTLVIKRLLDKKYQIPLKYKNLKFPDFDIGDTLREIINNRLECRESITSYCESLERNVL